MADSDKKERTARPGDWWVVGVEGASSSRHLFRYRGLWAAMIAATAAVSLVPLGVVFAIYQHQSDQAFSAAAQHPIRLTTSRSSSTLQFHLGERLSALSYIIADQPFAALADQHELNRIFRTITGSFSGFVDIGLIDADGIQRSYVGPYHLQGKDYSGQPWFKSTLREGEHVSDVFMGYRQAPHFALAVRSELDDGTPYVLRATLSATLFEELRQTSDETARGLDAFVINHDGVLQTPSRTYGDILSTVPFPVPEEAHETQVEAITDAHGGTVLLGHRHIERTPFVYVVAGRREELMADWLSLRGDLFVFLGVSVAFIIVFILLGTTYIVRRVRLADDRRVGLLHKMEYTAKMASIGRLAAGVAHEINNPLAIINEKAGLLQDFIEFSDDFPKKEQFLRHVTPIQKSVERCARITRRLLRFAKHLDIRMEPINLENLLREVLGFLEKESNYRNVTIECRFDADVPLIESDPGRLQQVFLNLINNAMGAVDDDGRIDITASLGRDGFVKVRVRDDGVGIPEENLSHIFEPFFTTKEKHGTGLGLSITYGIVSKLGGQITVDSKVGAWTEFTVALPIEPPHSGASEHGGV